MLDDNKESAGLVLLVGDGLVGAGTDGYDQILDNAVDVSKLGESPSPSSRSVDPQIVPRSLPPPPPLLVDELLLEEHDPELENAPLLLVDEVMVGKESVEGSM